MSRLARLAPILVLALLAACRARKQATPEGDRDPALEGRLLHVREPAVAGQFYPAHREALARSVDGLLAGAQRAELSELRALIVPHAGYKYSGPIAATAYAALSGHAVKTVYLLAPSHHVRFDGVSVTPVDAYETPLGRVLVSPLAARLRSKPPFVAIEEAEEGEHALEVQLPFLQRALGAVDIVPIIFGRVDERLVGEILSREIGKDAIVIASSDLSHYAAYDIAREKDAMSIAAIESLAPERAGEIDACGRGPVLALLELARRRAWRARTLDLRNSGDTAGDQSRVVGYAAVAFSEVSP